MNSGLLIKFEKLHSHFSMRMDKFNPFLHLLQLFSVYFLSWSDFVILIKHAGPLILIFLRDFNLLQTSVKMRDLASFENLIA